MSDEINFVGIIEDDSYAVITCDDKILKGLTEVCGNVMVKRKDRLGEPLINAGENEKMSFKDISVECLAIVDENAINNSAYNISENSMYASENIIVKNEDVLHEAHSDHLNTNLSKSCRSAYLVNNKNEETSEVWVKFTDAGENIRNHPESLTKAQVENSEIDKCNNLALGDLAVNSEDAPVESVIESINNSPIFGESVRDTDENVTSTTSRYISTAQADANLSIEDVNEDDIVESLTDTVANIVVSSIESDGTKEGASFSSENNESQLEYQENSEHSFSELVERKKPIEIKQPGKSVLSSTENGESSVLYEPDFYSEDEALDLYNCLINSTPWLDKNIVIHGVEYPQPRLVAWYGPLPYSYSGTTLEAAEMPDCVLAIKRRVEDYLKGKNIDVELNSVLLNLYRNNKDSVSWHSDDEITMGVCPTIASISLGETRKFEMRPKLKRYHEDEQEKDEYFVHLNNGSLIVMDGCMQEDWQHRVPKEYHDKKARINLTFRTVYKFENGSPYSYSRVNNNTLFEQEIPKYPCKIKIDLDEENFPPLGSVSSSGNSKISHKTSENESEMNDPSYEYLSKINDAINNSEEQWTIDSPLSNKTTSRINDVINGSEAGWIKAPVSSKALFEENDEVSTSQEEIDTKSDTSNRTNRKDNYHEDIEKWVGDTPCYEKPITKSNGSANESKENVSIDSLSNNEVYPEADNNVRKSENKAIKHTFSGRAPPGMNTIKTSEECVVTSPVMKDSSSQFREINKSNYNIYEESAVNSQLTLPESDSKILRDWYEKSCNSQILSESDEINELQEETHGKSFDYQQTSLKSDKSYQSDEGHFEKTYPKRPPFEPNKINKSHENKYVKNYFTRPNRFQSDRTYRHHEERAAKTFNKRNAQLETTRYNRFNERGFSESYNKNISRQQRNIKSDEVKNFENRNNDKSSTSNNEKYVKIEFPDENTEHNEQRFGKNQNSNSKERSESSSFAVHSFRKHFSDIRNEPGSNRSNGWKPNVKAEVFVPAKMKKDPSKMDRISSCANSSTYGHFSLENLLKYDVDRIPSDELQSYANALKLRVSDKISEFEPSDNEELEVLCEITDGNQTDRNQRIICLRICALVDRTMHNKGRNRMINRTMPRYHQQANYRNENHHSFRR